MTTINAAGLTGLRSAIREDDIKHDPWGTAMGWMFAVCHVLAVLDADIPARWEFRMGLGQYTSVEEMAGDPDAEEMDENLEYPDCDVARMVVSGSADIETLTYWGEVLHRYLALCKHHDRDY